MYSAGVTYMVVLFNMCIPISTSSITGPPAQHANGGPKKLSRRFSKEFSPHLPEQGAQNRARHAHGNGDINNAEFMKTPSAGVAG